MVAITHSCSQLCGLFAVRSLLHCPDHINVQHSDSIVVLPAAAIAVKRSFFNDHVSLRFPSGDVTHSAGTAEYTASLQWGKTPPTSVLIMILNNLMVKFQYCWTIFSSTSSLSLSLSLSHTRSLSRSLSLSVSVSLSYHTSPYKHMSLSISLIFCLWINYHALVYFPNLCLLLPSTCSRWLVDFYAILNFVGYLMTNLIYIYIYIWFVNA